MARKSVGERSIIMLEKKLLTSMEVISIIFAWDICFALVHSEIYFVEQVESVFSFSYTFLEEYYLSFLRAKIRDILLEC